MKTYKILVSGPFNAGKTTFIRTLCEKYLDTDKPLLNPIGDKTETTVALDFGVITYNDRKIRLFGTPGQREFFFMWEILAKGLNGYIFMIDSGDVEALHEAEELYRFFRNMLPEIPHVIALNKYDKPGFRFGIRETRMALGVPSSIPILKVDARDYESALNVVKTMIKLIEDRRWRL